MQISNAIGNETDSVTQQTAKSGQTYFFGFSRFHLEDVLNWFRVGVGFGARGRYGDLNRVAADDLQFFVLGRDRPTEVVGQTLDHAVGLGKERDGVMKR